MFQDTRPWTDFAIRSWNNGTDVLAQDHHFISPELADVLAVGITENQIDDLEAESDFFSFQKQSVCA